MNFLPTATKLFIAGCCAMIAFVTMGDDHREQAVGLSGSPVTTTTTTTTIAIVQNSTTTSTTTSTIPEEIPEETFQEELEPRVVTSVPEPEKATASEWGVVTDDAMEMYDKQHGRTPHEVGNFGEVPYLIDNMYGFWEKGSHIVDLQRLLGMNYVDGIYGPSTRRQHMEWFGSFEAAQRYFFNRDTWYMETIEPDAVWVHNWAAWDEPPSLQQLVEIYFLPEDRKWAFRVAFCESSALPADTYSNAVSSALAVGWFQHLSKFWIERSRIAGWQGYDIFDTEPNVAVAAWLFYETGGKDRHWYPSRSCWGDTQHGQ